MELLNNILTIIGYVGILYSVVQWLYFHKIHFFLWVNKVFSWKKDVNFELTILSNQSTGDLGEITKVIRRKTDNESRVISKSSTKIVFSYDTLIFQINKDEFDEENPIEIFVKNSNSTYKSAKKSLHKIGLIIDELRENDVLKPNKFQFVSSFKKNPFLGPSVSTIKVDNIKSFIMVLSSKTFKNVAFENDNDIQIGLNKISYVDTNYAEVKLVAEIILAI